MAIWDKWPFPCVIKKLKKVINYGLYDNIITSGCKAIGDGRYSGYHEAISTPNTHDEKIVSRFKACALKFHKKINSHGKTFDYLSGRFRHSVDRFKNCFGTDATIYQYQIENDKQIFDVLIPSSLQQD